MIGDIHATTAKVINYWNSPALIPVAVLFYLTQKLYIATARQVKRMESITRSPMYRWVGVRLRGARRYSRNLVAATSGRP